MIDAVGESERELAFADSYGHWAFVETRAGDLHPAEAAIRRFAGMREGA